LFQTGGAGFAVTLAAQAGLVLRADADTVPDLDVLDLGTDTDGRADDLVADAAGVVGGALGID
jgi:hypothetical protein